MGIAFGIMKRRLACYLSNTDDFVPPDGSDMVAGTWYYVGLVGHMIMLLQLLPCTLMERLSPPSSFRRMLPTNPSTHCLLEPMLRTLIPVYEVRISWIQLYNVVLSVEQVKAVQRFTGQSKGKNCRLFY